MKRTTGIIWLFPLLAVLLTSGILPGEGGFLRPQTPRDSILVMDRLAYGFEMKDVPDSVKLTFPEVQPQLMENVIALPFWQVDTLKTRKEKRTGEQFHDIRAQILIQPMEEGSYRLPALVVKRGADTLVFEPGVMDVCTLPVDTATFVIHDIKGQIPYPYTAWEILRAILVIAAAAGLIALLIYLIVKHRRKGQEAPEVKEPAHITALRKLDAYRGESFWEPEKQKGFYSGVTDALREYIASRYGVGAMEMTTAEIFDGLKETDVPADLYAEMKDLFERADFVKFAKFVAPREENATVVPQAVKFVTSTYQAEVEEEVKQPEETAEEEGGGA